MWSLIDRDLPGGVTGKGGERGEREDGLLFLVLKSIVYDFDWTCRPAYIFGVFFRGALDYKAFACFSSREPTTSDHDVYDDPRHKMALLFFRFSLFCF